MNEYEKKKFFFEVFDLTWNFFSVNCESIIMVDYFNIDIDCKVETFSVQLCNQKGHGMGIPIKTTT